MSAIDRIDLPFLGRSARSTCAPGTGSRSRWSRLVLVVNFRLRDSRVGRAWIALRDDEGAAASAGVPIVRTKLLPTAWARRSAACRARSWPPT